MKEQISIRVDIADRIYPLKVNVEEEEYVRKAADMINKKVKLYTEQYSIKDKQAALSMCALEIMTEYLNLESQKKLEIDDIGLQLNSIDQLLNDI